MDLKAVSPDQTVLWQWGPVSLNATILATWVVMGILVIGSWLITRRLSPAGRLSRWQNLLEILVSGMLREIGGISRGDPRKFLDFTGTLFVFILASNLLAVVPGYVPPTASLSTTAALAVCVFVAVPLYGIRSRGFAGFLKQYIEPTPLMLPFNVLGEVSRTLALAIRLFGNLMSGTKIVGILLAITPLFFPVVMNALGLLTGVIQAYIFAVLAMVYIASATRAHREKGEENEEKKEEEKMEKRNRNANGKGDDE